MTSCKQIAGDVKAAAQMQKADHITVSAGGKGPEGMEAAACAIATAVGKHKLMLSSNRAGQLPVLPQSQLRSVCMRCRQT